MWVYLWLLMGAYNYIYKSDSTVLYHKIQPESQMRSKPSAIYNTQ